MNIYIARHFWENGENATWECHKKIDKKLFKYLKDNYPFFSNEKPSQIRRDKYFVYPCYEDSIDNYGRTIVNITFFIAKREIKIDLCSKKNLNDLKIKIFNFRVITLYIFLLFVMIFSIYFFNNIVIQKNKKVTIENMNNKEKKDYSTFLMVWNNQVKLQNKNQFELAIDENLTFIKKLNEFTKTDSFTKDLTEDEIIKKLKELTQKQNISDVIEYITQ